MIRKGYEILYISLYRWSEKVNGKGYANNYSASLMMTLVIFIALTVVVSLLHLIYDWVFIATALVKGVVLFSMALVALLNYAYFTRKDRYQELLRSVNVEPKCNDGKIVLSVVLGLLLLLFAIWFFGMWLKSS